MDTVVTAIRRDWARVDGDIRGADNGKFCCDWWRSVCMRLEQEQFVRLWASPAVLCSVEAAGLVVRLSKTGPVPLPA